MNNNVEELLDKIYPNQINLKSFEIKDDLNSKIWKDGLLDPVVKDKLIKIAKEFLDYINLDIEIKPIDIIIVGSIASYNWSKYSDIDLHIVIDFNDVDDNQQLVTNYMYQLKSSWNDTHHNLNIYGYDVELYVQNKDDTVESNGIYSLKNDYWLKIPKHLSYKLDKEFIKKMSSKIINKIEKYNELFDVLYLPKSIKLLNDRVNYLYDNIIHNRKSSIQAEGEFGSENIIFKVLRRSGHLEMLHNLKDKLYDKMHTLE